MQNFCTLFNSNFLTRGIALYKSISANCNDFHLYILTCDTTCYDVLNEFGFGHVTLIPLNEFEDQDLLKVKEERTLIEYFWTCSSSLILYCINRFELSMCTYLDADLYFYDNPLILLDEIGDNDVIITEHRYTKENNLTKQRGRFNVQFMSFKNTNEGMKVLQSWRDKCIEWCYDKVEEGRFGDQKYLDYWPKEFKGIHILENMGGGVATWNINNYTLKDSKLLTFTDKENGTIFKLIFFHFHAVKFYANKVVLLSDDKISTEVKKAIYFPYINDLVKIEKEILARGFEVNSLGCIADNRNKLSFKDLLYIFRKELLFLLLNLKFRRFYFSFWFVYKKYINHNYYAFDVNGIIEFN